MKDLGEADVILGVKIRKNKTSLSLCQSHYVEKIIKKFDSFNVSSVRTPFDASKHLKKNKRDSVSQPEYAKIIGSVMYLMNYTRSDIAYAVSRLSRYTHNPDRYHWDALRHLLRYLKGTIDYCLHFNKFPAMKDIVMQTGSQIMMRLTLLCDSQAAICTAKNSVYNGKSRHTRLRHAVVKQLLKERTISLEFVRSEKNLADPLTKGLTRKVVLDSSVNMGLKPFGDP
ncbi:Retrovirus-related Pol polyprotein from transposon TNT 1-94 [Cucumis melo var. makuwa]|uniref:Retrovirus-related Pol polyprotein from transposon TNT 1-94 n=1 Tax=Cucumis melo var. makuwa TaxID=1194695 RepID=A0A5A7T3T2_CUCMM|nr:Retrovirus-related Pol polyprotein from transposon TNT 1-94 [Cucumis melo var. makuwa]